MVRDFEYYLLFQQKIYIQEGSNPETFALGDGFTKLSSVNSCRVKKTQPSGHPDFITFSAQNLLEWMKPGIRNAHNVLAPMLGKAPP